MNLQEWRFRELETCLLKSGEAGTFENSSEVCKDGEFCFGELWTWRWEMRLPLEIM